MAGHGLSRRSSSPLISTVSGLIWCPVSFVSAGVSVTSSNTGVPDISGSVYTKTQVITDHNYLKICTVNNCFPRRCSLNQAKHMSVPFISLSSSCSRLRSRVSTPARQQLRSACPRLWGAADPSTPRLQLATPRPPSCTSWHRTNSPTLRSCTTTCSRTDR